MMDEPSLGLAPLIIQEIFRIIRQIREKEGTAILLVEQNAQTALSTSDTGYIMENGKIVLDGPCGTSSWRTRMSKSSTWDSPKWERKRATAT